VGYFAPARRLRGGRGDGAQEPRLFAKYAFQLAQAFNNFYYTAPYFSEEDAQKRAFSALCGLVEASWCGAGFVGIEARKRCRAEIPAESIEGHDISCPYEWCDLAAR